MGGMIKKIAEWLGEKTSINHLPQTSVWNYLNHIHVLKKMKIVCLSKFFVKGFVPAKA